ITNRSNDPNLKRQIRKGFVAVPVQKEKPSKMPELVNRFCTPDRFDTEVAMNWLGYVPRVYIPYQPGVPRGVKQDRPTQNELLNARQPVQIIEVTKHVAAPADATPGK